MQNTTINLEVCSRANFSSEHYASLQVLIDNEINVLPVDVVKISNNYGIDIIKNSIAKELREDEFGISVFNGDNWYIVYDDVVGDISSRRFTIAHELGHILLGHPLVAGYHKRSRDKSSPIPRTETEADSFASKLLAPACVLWGLNIRTAAKIEVACKIPSEYAKSRANRMRELYKRNKFLTHKLETKLYN